MSPIDEEQQAIAHAVVNRVAASRGMHGPWEHVDVSLPGWLREALDGDDLATWGAAELGVVRERLLTMDEAKSGGVFYTPKRVADAMVQFSTQALESLGDEADPGGALEIVLVDPACGSGIFLVSAARRVATRYASLIARIAEAEVTEPMIRLVLPEVMGECVFGIDIDPVAVTMAKSALWLETGGDQDITFMDRNIIVGNGLEGPHMVPPKLEERYPTPAIGIQ